MDRLFNLIKNNFNLDLENNIYAFETSIETLSKEKIDFLSNSYINRISIGIQSLSPQVLLAEKRVCPSTPYITEILQYAINAFKYKKHIINVDLMADLDLQTPQILINDFKFLSNIGVPKITVYSKKLSWTHLDSDIDKLSTIRIKFIENLLQQVKHDGIYDYEKDITNESFYCFIRKDFDFNFDHIYMERPLNIDGKLNSVLGLGLTSNSNQGLESSYRQHGFDEYYHHNLFYWLKESTLENYKNYPFTGLRKKLYS